VILTDTTTMLRVLLVQTAKGLNPSSGGFKANVNILRSLARFGYAAAQICYSTDDEVELHVARAKANNIEPGLAETTIDIPLAPDVVHKPWIKSFTDEYNVFNVVMELPVYRLAYPRQEF
jgi:hypothetical protein